MVANGFLKHSIHSLGRVGHIEDIAVAKDQQGKKLGLKMIQALDYLAEKVGCYKVHTPSIRTFTFSRLLPSIYSSPFLCKLSFHPSICEIP